MRILIDMDGVICNYKDMAARMKKLTPSQRFPQSHEDFWIALKPIEGAIKAVNKLRRSHDVYILSGPSTRNPGSYSGKRIWVENHFDMDMVDRLILCNHKGLVQGDVLIDDNVKGKGQEHFEGTLVQFGSTDYPNWDSTLEKINKLDEELNGQCGYEDHLLQKLDGQIYCGCCNINLNEVV